MPAEQNLLIPEITHMVDRYTGSGRRSDYYEGPLPDDEINSIIVDANGKVESTLAECESPEERSDRALELLCGAFLNVLEIDGAKAIPTFYTALGYIIMRPNEYIAAAMNFQTSVLEPERAVEARSVISIVIANARRNQETRGLL